MILGVNRTREISLGDLMARQRELFGVDHVEAGVYLMQRAGDEVTDAPTLIPALMAR